MLVADDPTEALRGGSLPAIVDHERRAACLLHGARDVLRHGGGGETHLRNGA